ncbi:MAG: hypothetical protein ACYCZY_07655 [Lacisediminihabitans sp.]
MTIAAMQDALVQGTAEQDSQDQAQQQPVEQLTAWGARLDNAVRGIQELSPEDQIVAEEFALALDAVSRQALTTMVRRLRADERGTELLFELVDDPAVRLLLGMHGIIRLPDPEQAERASAGLGADGAPAGAAGRAVRTFISLDAMLRGPSASTGGACGTGQSACGPESCGCGGH